jgi:CheY-like chemotaxis protein
MKHRVLVIDDDHLVADTLRLVFSTNGFESEVCYSAAEALKLAKSFSPELLLCDVTLQGEDGLQLAAQVFRELPECQMIMLTAYLTKSASLEVEALRRTHPVKVLNKPCRPEVLIQEAVALLSARPPLQAAS